MLSRESSSGNPWLWRVAQCLSLPCSFHADVPFVCGENSGGPVEVVLKRLETAVPVVAPRAQEPLRTLAMRRTPPVSPPSPLAGFGGHETRVGQQDEVFGDRL